MPPALLALMLLAVATAVSSRTPTSTTAPTAPRAVDDSDEYSELPEDFIFGAGTSAIQTEGASMEGGKGFSVLSYLMSHQELCQAPDAACRGMKDPGLAADSYHRYKEDVEMAARLKLQAYRFSIAWARLFPDGDINNPNMEGVAFYNNLIDELVKKGIMPVITMTHFDYPLAVLKQTGGWTDPRIVPAFEEYADFLFKTYGDRVKLWTTINEPNFYCMYFVTAHQEGLPNHVNPPPGSDYKCSHHTVLAHAAVYRLYERLYKPTQGGRVGAAALTLWASPNSTRYEDIQAAARTNLFSLGTIYGPLVHGDYPELLKQTVLKHSLQEGLNASRLPSFTPEQKIFIKGTADFLSFNAYFTDVMVDNTHGPKPRYGSMVSDRNAKEVGSAPTLGNLKGFFERCDPDTLSEAAMWIRDTYDMPIFITENGYGDESDRNPLHDEPRRSGYHSEYLRTLLKTMKKEKVKVIGYLAWSLLDSYEWTAGYGRRFGLVHVDYENGSLNRTLKDSAWFFQHIGEHRRVPVVAFPRGPLAPTATPTASSSGDLVLPGLRVLLAALAAVAWLRC